MASSPLVRPDGITMNKQGPGIQERNGMKSKVFVAASVALALLSGAAACSSSKSSGGSSGKQITVWSEENDADRITATQANIAKFTAATGIKVKLVGIDGNQFQSLIT
ncbi:MAG TPA: hypothetical protein VIV12_28040, partial [Streptosporangiaceae bacterium]